MKKKLILLCSILFLACGCTAVYDVDLTNGTVNEKLSATGQTEEEIELLQQYSFYTPAFYDEQGASEENVKIDGVEYYNISHQNNLNMSYSFQAKDYNRSNLIHYCFENMEFQKNNESILVSTGKKFNCFEMHPDLTAVQINVRVPENYELVSTNSKQVNGTLYSWTMTKESKDNSIFLSLKRKNITNVNPGESSSQNGKKNTNPEETKNSIITILGCLAGFVVILFIVIKMNQKKNEF